MSFRSLHLTAAQIQFSKPYGWNRRRWWALYYRIIVIIRVCRHENIQTYFGFRSDELNSSRNVLVDRDSSVGIATRYGFDGSGIESRCGWGFPHQSRPALGTHAALYTMGTGSFPGVKRPEHGVNHPPPSSAEFKGRVRLYFYSPCVPSWQVVGWILSFFIVNILVGQAL